MNEKTLTTPDIPPQFHGWLIIDKPLHVTSARVVSRVKKLLKVKKIGHAGTLDPLASGILPLAIGEATKTVSFVMSDEKGYVFDVTWGSQTSTDDLEGEVVRQSDMRPSESEIQQILHDFIGDLSQVPPIFSAIKVDGKRAYKSARAGENIDLPSRKVQIFDLRVQSHSENEKTRFYVRCGKGTYVRSLARDLGERLGCFGHVSYLRRIQVGRFDEKSAISLDILEKSVHNCERYVLSIPHVLDDIPAVIVNDNQETALRQGRFVTEFTPDTAMHEEPVLCLNGKNPVALARFAEDGLRPFKVFNI